MDVVIAGFGTVGQGIAEVIAQKRELFTGNFHQDVRIVGVFDSTSYEASPGGLDPSTLIARKMSTGKVGTRQDKATEELLLSLDYDTLKSRPRLPISLMLSQVLAISSQH